jgi:hypothetical protein
MEVPEMVFYHVFVSIFCSKESGEVQVRTYRSSGAANPGAQDAAARGLDIDGRAVVGVAGLGIVPVGGADGADGRLGSGRVVRGVGVVVAGGDSQEDTGIDEGRSRVVDGSRVATAQGHVGDGTVGAVALGRIVDDEVDAGNDTGAKGVEVRG